MVQLKGGHPIFKVHNSFNILPIAKHLEERVVVEVLPHIVEVIVLAASADALLGVRCLGQLRQRQGRVRSSQEKRLELHSSERRVHVWEVEI